MATELSPSNGSHPNGSYFPGGCTHGDPERPQFTLRVGCGDPERVIFFLGGDLLFAWCLPFEHFTQECIDGGTRRLRLDLTQLQSLDLDGVDCLMAVHRRLSAVGGRLFLTNASPAVLSVLRLFGRPLLTTGTSVVFTPADGEPGRGEGRRLAG